MAGSDATSSITFTERVRRAVVRWRASGLAMAAGHAIEHAQQRAIYVGDHTLLVRTIFGHKLYLDSRDLTLTPRIALGGFWEMHVTRFLLRTLRPGMRVVEVGANVGFYTLLMASRVGPSGRVFAFEANPDLAELLRRSVDINGDFINRVEVIPKAATNHGGHVTFHCVKALGGAGSLGQPSDDFLKRHHTQTREIDVEATTLDAFLGEMDDPRVDLIRLDAEGAEPLILEGARQTLAGNPNVGILLEYIPDWFKRFDRDPRAFIHGLEQEGVQIHRLTRGGRAARVGADELGSGYQELLLTR